MPIWRLLARPLSLKQVDNLPPRRTITEESFLFTINKVFLFANCYRSNEFCNRLKLFCGSVSEKFRTFAK